MGQEGITIPEEIKGSKREKNSQKDYVDAAMERIRQFATASNEEIGGCTATAIQSELNTMFVIGLTWEKD